MVESTALEMRRAGNGTVGSNPTLSANILLRINEMCLTGPENPQLPRGFGYGARTSETAGAAKIGL